MVLVNIVQSYNIKQKPEDFVVTEQIALHIGQETQKYVIFKLTKRATNTIQAIDILTKKLGLQKRDIGFAGIKDKHAITTQYISLPLIPKITTEKVLRFATEYIHLEFVGYARRPIATDVLTGNSFRIVVHNMKPKSLSHCINYFGEQRFSTDNALIGKLLVQKQFKDAVERIAKGNKTYNEKLVRTHLDTHPADFIGALRLLPRQSATLYIHAYQSLLWNKTIAKRLGLVAESESDNYIAIPDDTSTYDTLPQNIPLIGFFYEPSDWPADVQETITEIMQEEGITPRDFIIKQFGELTEKGSIRQVCIPITDLTITQEASDTHVISFTLPKGSYATVVLRFLAS